MVHTNESAWSHLAPIFLYVQRRGALAHDIPVFPAPHSVDFSAGGYRCSLCAAWICHWKEGHSYVFSRWISRHILSIPYDKFYSGSHCTHQSHISGPLPTPLPPWCGANSTRIRAPQFPSALLILDSLSSISFHSQFLLFQRSCAGIGTP